MSVSEADKVLAGMEIVSWEYKPAFWESECLPQIEAGLSTSRAFSPGLALGTVGGGCLATYALALSVGASMAFAGGIAAALGVVAGALLLPGYVRWRQVQPDNDVATAKRRALFTANGVLFGPVARLWKGNDYRLIHAGIERSGTTVRLVFTPSFGPITRLDIPVPVEFEKELPELVRLLELKTPSGAAETRERDIPPRPIG